MKQLKILIVCITCLCGVQAVGAQNSLFDKYGDMKDVTSVYISKTMLDLQTGLYTDDLNIGKVAGDLEAVYVISTFNLNIKKELRNDIESYIKKSKYELLMKKKGNVSSSTIYILKKGDKVKELVMITDGAAKLSFILLKGEIALQDIKNMTYLLQANNQFKDFVIPELEEICLKR